jgi:integrase
MRRNITLNALKRLQPQEKPYFIRSTTLRGFGIKVNTSGVIKYFAETKYQGTNYRRDIGTFPVMSIAEAERDAMLFLNLVQTGQYQTERKQQFTLQRLLETYTARVNLKSSTAKSYREVISFYLRDWLDKPVASITKEMVENRYYRIRDKGINGGKPTYASAAKVMRTLSALMNYALADELIETNPVYVLKLKRIPRTTLKRENYLKVEEVRELLNVTSGETRPMVLAILLILYTGLRKSEAFRLEWEDIETVNGVSCLIIRDTKNNRPHYVPITKPINQILARAKNDTKYVFPSNMKKDCPVSNEKRTLRSLSKAIGVTFKCHDLRRTFATRAMEVGIDYLMVKRLLNHKTNDITAQYIQWHSRENLEVMRKALETVVY